jgi:hypothetical protein
MRALGMQFNVNNADMSGIGHLTGSNGIAGVLEQFADEYIFTAV